MNDEKVFFDMAADYADKNSTCRKVHVGSCFVTSDGREFLACNNGGTKNCNELGYCYKAKVTGIYESCEATRPYCQSVHSEVNMLKVLEDNNVDPSKGTLYVTRYCCENCAKNCIKAGIKRIKYCGRQRKSSIVESWLDNAGVEYDWFPQYDYEYTWKDIKYWEIFGIKDLDRLKSYIDFIKSIENDNIEGFYTERHHIVPTFLGVDNDDYVLDMKARNHFIAHKLLVNCFESYYNAKAAYALVRMAKSTDKQVSSYEVSPEEYEFSCSEYSKSIKEKNNEYGFPLIGKHLSEEHKKHISETHPDVSGENNPFYGLKHSDETKEKMREAAKNRDPSTYNISPMVEHNIGNKYASNSIWMSDGVTDIKVPKDDNIIESYIQNGYVKGRKPRPGYKWINNGEINTRVKGDSINEYLSKGWKLGRI